LIRFDQPAQRIVEQVGGDRPRDRFYQSVLDIVGIGIAAVAGEVAVGVVGVGAGLGLLGRPTGKIGSLPLGRLTCLLPSDILTFFDSKKWPEIRKQHIDH
jgi:hypothetical protein